MRGGSHSSNLHYDSGSLECDTCSLVATYQQFRRTYCIHVERQPDGRGDGVCVCVCVVFRTLGYTCHRVMSIKTR